MSFWTSHPNKADAEIAESLAYSPSGGRLKMWLLGAGLALIPIGYGLRCLFTGQALFFARRGAHLEVTGPAAVSLAIAYIAVGMFIHAHWFWGLHPRLEPLSEVLKILSVLVFLAGLGYAIYKILI